MSFLRRHSCLILLLLFSAIAIVPFFQLGFFPIHDDTQVARVYEMGRALSDGQFPVRWVKDLGYSYGYPLFNFYSPLPYYIGGFLTLFGVAALLATKFVFVLGIILAGFSMYVLVREFTEELAALVAATVYLYFPYHAVNIFVRGDLDELFAYAFLPIVFLGIFKLYYRSKSVSHIIKLWKEIAFLSFSIVLVILSHNLLSFMLLLFIIPLMIMAIVFSQRKISLAIVYGLALILGFGISGFYSLPALFEMKYTNVLSQVGGGAYYPDHFVCPLQLWDSLWGFGGSTKGCIDGMSFRLGKINVIFFAGSIITFCYFLIKHKHLSNKLVSYSSVIFFAISLFMMVPLSQVFWDMIPFMAFLQYPWRFLNFAGLFLALTIGISVFQLEKLLGKKNILLLIFILITAILFYHAKLFVPKEYYVRNSNFYTNDHYLTWTVSKISDEYMPEYFQKPQKQGEVPKSPIDIVEGKGTKEVDINRSNLVKARVNLSEDSLVRLNIAYFPAWNLLVDNNMSSFEKGSNGLYIPLSQGSHTIQVEFNQTSVETFSNMISLISILSLILGIIALNPKFYGKKTS